MAENEVTPTKPSNFIKNIINDDLKSGRVQGGIVTRFPPEPNGYLHIGHAFAALLNFTIIDDYPGSRCHLRFDDTNPEREDIKFINAIQEDLRWLGVDWGEHLYFASDYFDKLFDIALELIRRGKAYVCFLSQDQLIEYRGTLTEKGKPSPHRETSVEENLEAFEKMKTGEYGPGQCVLRAKIDMASGNLHMRDPVLYRIKHMSHPKVGDKWKIYPSYDFTHCLSDALEHITHSLCSIEFQDHRPLYDWLVAEADLGATPHQYEFTRLNIDYTVTSKRKLMQLVDEHHVSGWDDPRMPTLAGMRNRGYPPEAIRAFCSNLGVSRRESIIEYGLLEEAVRGQLNETAKRAMVVLEPLKVTISNMAEDHAETLAMPNHPQNADLGERSLRFGRHVYIDRQDFLENPPKNYFRLSPGQEVRLRGSYIIKCDEVIKDASGTPVELICSYDPATLGKKPEGRKVKGVIHWAHADDGLDVEITEYDRLFKEANPSKDEKAGVSFLSYLNENSLILHRGCIAEPSLAQAEHGETFQFERLGYYCAKRSPDGVLSFIKVVSLRDSWQG